MNDNKKKGETFFLTTVSLENDSKLCEQELQKTFGWGKKFSQRFARLTKGNYRSTNQSFSHRAKKENKQH
jgi:hypothetical protein